MELDKIIEMAKKQEKWSANHKWNFGPIEYLKSHVIDGTKTFKRFSETYDLFVQNVHHVTDAETFFVYKHCDYDIYVDADFMVCIMRKAFPEISFETICEWLKKHEEPHQYTKAISKNLMPK